MKRPSFGISFLFLNSFAGERHLYTLHANWKSSRRYGAQGAPDRRRTALAGEGFVPGGGGCMHPLPFSPQEEEENARKREREKERKRERKKERTQKEGEGEGRKREGGRVCQRLTLREANVAMSTAQMLSSLIMTPFI